MIHAGTAELHRRELLSGIGTMVAPVTGQIRGTAESAFAEQLQQ